MLGRILNGLNTWINVENKVFEALWFEKDKCGLEQNKNGTIFLALTQPYKSPYLAGISVAILLFIEQKFKCQSSQLDGFSVSTFPPTFRKVP